MAEAEEEVEFKWGKKRGIGGKKKDVQFYESFTYDGVDYSLYDIVYLHTDAQPDDPYIGKLIKIWENRDKSRKVKVQWFFRPQDIPHLFRGNQFRDDELFFACGQGTGLANVNPLEAIGGKCNVVCISKDTRNPQPSDEAIQNAHFVFYRFFDVGRRKILDEIDDKIAGLEVKDIFNRMSLPSLCPPYTSSSPPQTMPRLCFSTGGEESSATMGLTFNFSGRRGDQGQYLGLLDLIPQLLSCHVSFTPTSSLGANSAYSPTFTSAPCTPNMCPLTCLLVVTKEMADGAFHNCRSSFTIGIN
ncbi:hypothetical protein RJT34_16587 [Clitoria ternatea]|uniref:BAH domain-containing protein n=1 Tax=Clitoria ternatea TaxID=43366 RepID=A0AAN9J8L7_CLITE